VQVADRSAPGIPTAFTLGELEVLERISDCPRMTDGGANSLTRFSAFFGTSVSDSQPAQPSFAPQFLLSQPSFDLLFLSR
jgi:hypothetical protein